MGRSTFLLVFMSTMSVLLTDTNVIPASVHGKVNLSTITRQVYWLGSPISDVYPSDATRKRFLRTNDDEELVERLVNDTSSSNSGSYLNEERAAAIPGLSKLTTKFQAISAEVKLFPGVAKLLRVYGMVKFQIWFKMGYTPDKFYKNLKLGTGTSINAAKHPVQNVFRSAY